MIYIPPFNLPARKKYGFPLISRVFGRKASARPVDFGTQTSRSQTCSSYGKVKKGKTKLNYTYSVRKDDNETVFPDHHALLDGEAKYPTERWKSSSIFDSGRKSRVPTLDVLSIPNPQTFCTPNGQQGTAIASYWNNARSGQ
jgi:hypothetical protein